MYGSLGIYPCHQALVGRYLVYRDTNFSDLHCTISDVSTESILMIYPHTLRN